MNKATPTKSRVSKARVATPTSSIEEAPTPAPSPIVETAVETAVETTEVPAVATESLRERFERLIKTKQEQVQELRKEMQELRKMQKDHESALKEASKRPRRKRTSEDGVTRKPSGFASPVVVSDELYTFLSRYGVKKGQPIARTDVTRHITAYIKEHDLQNPEHRREILPDATLTKLFGPAVEPRDASDPKSEKVYSYLKLQKHLSAHFPKKTTA